MQSCYFVERGITFAPDGLYFCSIPVHGDSGWLFICPYDGGELPVSAILEARSRARAGFAGGDLGVCSGCTAHCAEFNDTRDGEHLFHNLNIEHYTICNLRCSYCCWRTNHPTSYGLQPYPTLPVLTRIFDENLLAPDGSVFWGGGEPSLLSEFGACMDLCAKHSIRVDVSSNATVFSEPIRLGLAESNCTLCVSVDAGTAETYQAIKGADALESAWQNLKIYAKANEAAVAIKYLVMRENCGIEDFDAFASRLKEFGRGSPIIIDMTHHLPVVEDGIIRAMSELADRVEELGFKASVGLHGANTLPRQRVRERVAEYRKK